MPGDILQHFCVDGRVKPGHDAPSAARKSAPVTVGAIWCTAFFAAS